MRKVAVALFMAVVLAISVAGVEAQGMLETELVDTDLTAFGRVNVWNTTEHLWFEVIPFEGEFLISAVYIAVGEDPPPISSVGNPILEKFDHHWKYPDPSSNFKFYVGLFGLGFPLSVDIAVYAVLVPSNGKGGRDIGVWAFGPYEFPGPRSGWWLSYDIDILTP